MSKYEIMITKNSLSLEEVHKIEKAHSPMRPEVIDWYRRIQMSSLNPIGRVRSDVKIDFSTQAMTFTVHIYNIEALNTNPINNYRSKFLNCDNQTGYSGLFYCHIMLLMLTDPTTERLKKMILVFSVYGIIRINYLVIKQKGK